MIYSLQPLYKLRALATAARRRAQTILQAARERKWLTAGHIRADVYHDHFPLPPPQWSPELANQHRGVLPSSGLQ